MLGCKNVCHWGITNSNNPQPWGLLFISVGCTCVIKKRNRETKHNPKGTIMLKVKFVYRYGRSLLSAFCIHFIRISAPFQKAHRYGKQSSSTWNCGGSKDVAVRSVVLVKHEERNFKEKNPPSSSWMYSTVSPAMLPLFFSLSEQVHHHLLSHSHHVCCCRLTFKSSVCCWLWRYDRLKWMSSLTYIMET